MSECTWNHRVIEFADTDGTPWQQIHEVHYDEDGKPVAYTEEATPVMGANKEELLWVLDQMRRAVEAPVLIERDFQDELAAQSEAQKK